MNTNDDKMRSPRVTVYLNNRLKELDMTRSDFIRKFHRDHGDSGSRNHLFKILNGQAIVGEVGLLPKIIKTLGLDLNHAIQLVRADKIQSKDWGHALPKASKSIQEAATLMETLSKRDQEEVLRFIKMKANLL
jgi:hypothetical protein